MTDRFDTERRERRQGERQTQKAKKTVSTVVAIMLVVACISCISIIGVTMAKTMLPDSQAAAATEVNKLGMISADTGMEIATQKNTQSDPTDQGTPLHYYAYGKTSYGYNWDYSADSDIVNVSCEYNFDVHGYDLIVAGKAPGTANVTLYYFTDDNVSVPIHLTVSVDDDLNVTQI